MSFDKIIDTKKVTIKAVLLGACIALATTLGILFIFSVIYCYIDVKDWLGSVFALLSLTVGAFFGARYTVSVLGEKGFLFGVLTGFILFILVFIFSLVFGDGKISITSLFNLICSVLSGGISGIIRVNKELNKKYLK